MKPSGPTPFPSTHFYTQSVRKYFLFRFSCFITKSALKVLFRNTNRVKAYLKKFQFGARLKSAVQLGTVTFISTVKWFPGQKRRLALKRDLLLHCSDNRNKKVS